MDRTFSPSRVEKTTQQFKRNRRENRWDGGRECVQRLKTVSGENGDENQADYFHL